MFDFLSPAEIQHLIHAYGLWTLFAVLMFESIGLPLPGETALVATALYAGSTHQIGIFPVIGVAASAAIVGDNIGYLLGRSVGGRFVMRYGRYVYLTETRLKLGQYLFQRHGGKIVFFGRFVAFLRTFAALLAGVNRMRWPHFLAMNALGGIAWASLFGGGAYLFDKEINVFAGPIRVLFLSFALALTVAGAVYFRRHEAQLVRRLIAAHPDK